MDNPYAAPEAKLIEPEAVERPRSPKVIAGLLMLFSIVSLLMGLVMLIALSSGLSAVVSSLKALGLSGAVAYISTGIEIFFSCWLLFIGLKLFKYRDVGRRQFKVYIIFQVILSTITLVYQYANMSAHVDKLDMLSSSIIFNIVVMGIMIWLLSGLNKPHVRASLT